MDQTACTFLTKGTRSVVPGPAASASLENLSETQHVWTILDLLSQNWHFKKIPQEIQVHIWIWEPLFHRSLSLSTILWLLVGRISVIMRKRRPVMLQEMWVRNSCGFPSKMEAMRHDPLRAQDSMNIWLTFTPVAHINSKVSMKLT